LSKNFWWCVLTSSVCRAYKPLTDEDGGASGADDLLRSGVSRRNGRLVGVICWKAVISSVIFDWVLAHVGYLTISYREERETWAAELGGSGSDTRA
jgi:hypothetical protein